MEDDLEFAKALISRAKAREEAILKRQDKGGIVTNEVGRLMEKQTDKPSSQDFISKKEANEVSKSIIPVPPELPPSPGNKENYISSSTPAVLEDEDEEMMMDADLDSHDDEEEEQNSDEECQPEMNEEDVRENDTMEVHDEVLPLSKRLTKSSGLIGSLGHTASSSPVSRKSRLSALAMTINAWEDDVSPSTRKSIVPQKQDSKRTSRFSVSSSSPIRTAQGQRNIMSHQFVRSKSASPTKVVTPSSCEISSPTKTPLNTSFVSSSSTNNSSPTKIGGSPWKEQQYSTPTSNASSSNSASPVKIASPMKKPQHNVSFSSTNSSPTKPARSPLKQQIESPRKILNSTATSISGSRDDSLVKNLELQGFVKLQAGQLQQVLEQQQQQSVVPKPPKVVKSIMKKPLFEKGRQALPKSPTRTSSSQWQKQQDNKSQPQQYNSRKSLQLDPSELTVAQKAKLFEKQQQEQEYVSKQPNANKLKPMINLTATQTKVAKPNEPVKSPIKNISPETASPKKNFYFGDSVASVKSNEPEVAPIPPPLPPKLLHSPVKTDSPVRTTVSNLSPRKSPSKSSPWKRSYCEEEDFESEYPPIHNALDTSKTSSQNTSQSSSPSAQIAKSVKRIKVIQKDNKMYPSLTDIESTEVEETDMDNDNETNTSSVDSSPAPHSLNSTMSTSSLGSFIQTKAQSLSTTNSEEINTTMACRQIDQLIDDALEGQLIEDDTFMMEEPVPISFSSPIVKKEHYQPLMHTVSLYRKNQQQSQFKKPEAFEIAAIAASSMPVMQSLPEEKDEENDEVLHDKMQDLEQQVLIQQKSIAQASKALNICESSFEFTNSTENVEGERVLLIATQKRCQLLSHINKLKNGNRNEPDVSPSKDKFKPSSTRGTIKIDSIQLYPIKSARLHKDYVYHFIVIMKHNENVHATCTVKTSASNTVIDFPNEFLLQEIDPSFKIQIEVYALRTFKQMDVIPHHMKYHIKKPPSTPNSSSSGSCSTPSKTSTLSHFLTPTRSSKHTPKATDLKSTVNSATSSNTIRTANFTLQAVLNLNLSNLNNKTEWEMTMVNSNLILPNISMNIRCTNKNELNYKGFLTVFTDVSGLGAWHRRFAMIDENYQLLFWTYPEDEAHGKPPVLSLSLSSCITPRIAPTPREMCARPNTFILVTTRKPLESDKPSLVVSVHEKYTAIKHLISADNRIERDTWIGFINTALTNMRAWGINQKSENGF